MKIAVIGPQNTGKTTFIKDFLLEFPYYTTPTETYRDLIKKENLEINQKTSEYTQKLIRDFLYNQIINNTNEKIIFDRCVIDNYVYSKCANLEKSFLETTKRKLYDSLDYLDLIIFIPTSISINLIQDNLRDIDKNFIDKVNLEFLNILFEISNKTNILIKVIAGDRYDRIKMMKDFLN